MRDNFESIVQFQHIVWEYFRGHKRTMPWREPGPGKEFDPYKIMVSELMLQQTQVARVIPKYDQFIRLFPNIAGLAAAELKEVLSAWSGLGYNRRAKFLWQAAQKIQNKYQGHFPQTNEELIELPGIGKNTAGAIIAYAYNEPVVFIETNIRTVFIHHFFQDRTEIQDKEILKLVSNTLPEENIREWYWALMDYGTHLKSTVGNANIKSKNYAKQSAFHGSARQLRGQVLKLLQDSPKTLVYLKKTIQDERLTTVLVSLEAEQLIHKDKGRYFLG